MRRGSPVDATLISLAVALAAPLMVLGGVTETGLLIALITVALASAITAARSTTVLATQPTKLASVALWLVVLFIALQLVPLPPALLRAIAPASAGIWGSADSLLGRAPGSHPIAIDPPATTFMLLTATCGAAFHWNAAAYSSDPPARTRLVVVIASVVLAFDVIALAHKLTGATKLFWFYAPVAASGERFLAPLLNPNHAAAVAAIAPPLLIGLALQARESWVRVFATLGAIVSGATVLATLSRGGIVSLGVELAAMAAFAVLSTRRRRSRGTTLVLAVVAATAVIGLMASIEGLRSRASGSAYSKTLFLPHAFSVARAYFWVGAGRGGFGAASPAFEAPLSDQTAEHRYLDTHISHVESWPGQLAVDLGAPMAFVYVGLLGAACVLAARGAFRRPVTAGAAAALLGLAVHDLFDFSLEFVGVGLLGAALLGVVTASAGRTVAREVPLGRRLSLAFAVAAVLCLLPLSWIWKKQAAEEARALAQRWQARGLADADGDLRAAIARHPSDPFFPMLAGVRVLSTPDAAPYLIRAVKLGPARAQTHFWLARWFATMSLRGQAWAEYREALRLAPAYADPVMADMLTLKAPLDDIDAVAIDGNALERASYLLARVGRFDDAAALDERHIARFPPAVPARVRQIDRARKRNDLVTARKLIAELQQSAPNAPQGFILEAELEPDAKVAEEILVRGLARAGDDIELLFALIRKKSERIELDQLANEIERLSRAITAKEGSAWRMHAFLGDLELERKRPARALKHFLDAATASPDGLARLEQAALLAESLGAHRAATDAWSKLSYAHPDEPRFQQGLARAQAAAKAKPVLSPSLAAP